MSSSLDAAKQRTTDVLKRLNGLSTRRKLLVSGGAIGVAGIAGASIYLSGGAGSSAAFALAARQTPRGEVKELEGGFVMVDGWILKKSEYEDMRR